MHLVFLPGLDGTGDLFQPFVDEFEDSENISIISYPTDRHIPYEELINYVISRLPKNKPLVILGESYSGIVALGIAEKNKLTIDGLILVATFAKYPPSLFKILSGLTPLSLLFRFPIPDFLIKTYCFSDAANESLNSMLRKSVKSNNPAVLAKRAHEGATLDVTHLLKKISIPCLVISASDDKLVPASATEYLSTHLLNASKVTITGPHFILQTQPKECFKAIQQWLMSKIELE